MKLRFSSRIWFLNRLFLLIQIFWFRLTKQYHVSFRTYLDVDPNSQINIPNSSKINSRYFHVGNNSSLTLGEHVLLSGYFHIGDDCTVVIGDNFRMLKHPSFVISNGSWLEIGDYGLFEETRHAPAQIAINRGKAQIGRNVAIRGTIKVTDGDLSIGSDTFINHGAEVRCEEAVVIGHHVLISYFVDIFDTNTHSLDWEHRQQEINDGFPNGTTQTEANKPQTAPITIGNHVWIGKYSAVLKGCQIGDRSVIGTRAVVTHSFGEDSLIVGNPAQASRSAAN